ncbi:hypothetical protein PF049_01785 [Erythrobacteraceae bacterium WH01K]|nr:hypothetical protein PF049_01785 [Erythrobacteraceae bacterium WH01K]
MKRGVLDLRAAGIDWRCGHPTGVRNHRTKAGLQSTGEVAQ